LRGRPRGFKNNKLFFDPSSEAYTRLVDDRIRGSSRRWIKIVRILNLLGFGRDREARFRAIMAESDGDLLERIRAGDQRGLQALYGRHHVKIFRFALRLVHSEASAEDIVSEVFIDVWRNATNFEGRSEASTWLLAIARNKAYSLLRRKKEDGLDDEMAAAIEDKADNPEVVLQKKSKGELLRACLSGLSREHREVIDLVYYHDKSVEEVALIVGAPEGTVKTRMFHARKKLSQLAQAAGIDRGWP
jgi:RNA polymerase sigma-70 factor (ECF subfamily)